jgi:hypothetical protein
MSQYIVLEGYVDDSKADPTEVLLVDGMTITVSREKIHKQVALDTGNTPLLRIFLDPEATISFTIKAKDLMGTASATGGTILKWMDDGGTISKSRDDNRSSGTITKWLDDGGTISKSRDDGF